MKLSCWNSYLDVGDSTWLVYNSLSDKFIAVFNTDIIDALRNGDVKSLPKDVKSQLTEIGGIVNEEVDELGLLLQKMSRVDNDNSFFHIILNPTLDCNLHCWYCYENHSDKSLISGNLIESVKQLIKKRAIAAAGVKTLVLSFFGGEPLLAFKTIIRDFMDWCREYCTAENIDLHIHFTSNGVLLGAEEIDFLKNFDCSFQITLDGGKADHDNTRFEKGGIPTYDRIVNNILRLNHAGIPAVVRINYTQKNLQSVQGIIDTFVDAKPENPLALTFDFQKVWQDKPSEAVESEMAELVKKYRGELRKAGFKVSNSRLDNYVHNSCYADKTNEVLVNYNGDLFACTARDFDPKNRKGRLLEDGSIQWFADNLPNKSSLKMTKEICRRCRIAPICGSGCHQKNIESASHELCNLGYDNKQIDELILERFEEYFISAAE